MLRIPVCPSDQTQHAEQRVAVSWILYSEVKPGEADPDLSLSHPEPRLQASSP